MTVLAAYTDGKRAALAADRGVTQDDRVRPPQRKLSVVGGGLFAIGLAGETFVDYIFQRIAWPAEINEHVICAELRKALDAAGYGSAVDDDGRGSRCYGTSGLIISADHQVFEVTSNLIPTQVPPGSPCAFGSGRDFALGKMFEHPNLDPVSIVVGGCMAACALSISCCKPIDCVTSEGMVIRESSLGAAHMTAEQRAAFLQRGET